MTDARSSEERDALLSGHVVVVSPHLDDAALSLGAAISWASRAGADVEVVTVFAGDPDSPTPSGPWARRSGFRVEGEEARARRREDAAACALLGARWTWLPFGDLDHDRRGDEGTVSAAVAAACDGADAALLPGFPLVHPDHAWLSPLLLRRGLPCRRLGLYAEQPYRFVRRRSRLAVPDCLRPLVPPSLAWTPVRAGPEDWVRKWRSVRRYRSQLAPLGLARLGGANLLRLLLHELSQGGEAVAWLPAAGEGAEQGAGAR